MEPLNPILDVLNNIDSEVENFVKDIENLLSNYGKISLIIHALENNLFDYLNEPKSVIEIAKHYGWNETLTGLYCKSLASLLYLTNLNDITNEKKYCNSYLSKKYLISESDLTQFHNLKNKIRRIKPWVKIDNIMKNGPLIYPDSELMTIDWMKGIAQSSFDGQISKIIAEIENFIDLNKIKQLLDLGGGHGLYSIAFSSKYPNIQCTVYDKSKIIGVAEYYIAKARITVNTIEGDYNNGELPRNNEIIFSSFSNCGSEPALLKKIADSLINDGYFIIRRHSEHLAKDPLQNLEWNLMRPESRKNLTTRYALDSFPTIAEYIELMKENQFRIIVHKSFDDTSEIIIAQKQVKGEH